VVTASRLHEHVLGLCACVAPGFVFWPKLWRHRPPDCGVGVLRGGDIVMLRPRRCSVAWHLHLARPGQQPRQGLLLQVCGGNAGALGQLAVVVHTEAHSVDCDQGGRQAAVAALAHGRILRRLITRHVPVGHASCMGLGKLPFRTFVRTCSVVTHLRLCYTLLVTRVTASALQQPNHGIRTPNCRLSMCMLCNCRSN
jgi:hypothetical protein